MTAENQRDAKRIARSGTQAERAALAGEAETAPELLYYLARDPDRAVRAAVAANTATPPQADRLLAGDEDTAVREALGRKLAPLAPVLSQTHRDRLQRMAWETLCRLVSDAAVTVRAAIAEALKAMPDAPRETILKLARDASMEVAEPVIRFSPLLTEADLTALVMGPPVPETVVAVARRPDLSEAVSDAIAEAGDPVAITALLGNSSAAIREATLDALIAGAGQQVAWQEKLVARPGLPKGAAQALVMIVADHLLGALAARPDLDPAVTASIRQRVAARLAEQANPPPPTAARSPAESFAEAARLGDRATMVRLLSEGAAVPVAAVQRAVRLRSGKTLVSLCWKAGLTPRCALLAQTVLAGMQPSLSLAPHGGWPYPPEEMKWQLELLVEAAC
ncbi:DUF2336 domain-containing protein [Crenalkalicoccus roseus]|uniref:DUF2336 domain-containing protein n=1 Tax=Crenalkalicoccus roseus TaxID=1485588 RepID=UPI001081D7EC|nr:DUF2336 domain-containing protein [Crenalkalicoccus roseus]